MPNITLSIPQELYERMKRHKEVKWSEVVRKAIVEYLEKIEKGGLEVSSRELLRMAGRNLEERVRNTPIERYEDYYDKARKREWKRLESFTTQTSS